MEVVSAIVSAVLLVIVVPVLGIIVYRLLDTATSHDLSAHATALQKHAESDDRCFTEIRQSIVHLGDKIDDRFNTMQTTIRNGH